MADLRRLTESDFLGMEEEWDAFLGSSRSDNFFLSWEWLSHWWRHFGKGKELFLLALYDSAGLMALAPLYRERKLYFSHFPVSRIGFLGSEVVDSDYLDFISRPGYEALSTEVFLKHLCSECTGWDLLELSDIGESSPTVEYFKKWSPSRPFVNKMIEAEICPYLSLPSSAHTYSSGLSKNNRYNIRRRTQNLYKLFGQEGIELAEHRGRDKPEELLRLMGALFKLHRARWGAVKRKTVFSLREVESFHMSLLPGLLRKGSVLMFSLSLNSEIVGAIYGFVHGGKYSFYQSGFDPGFASYSPGLVLMNYSIERAIEHGLSEYDFLRGEETYKSKFTGTFRQTYRVEIWRNKTKSKYVDCARGIYGKLNSLRKKLLKSLNMQKTYTPRELGIQLK
jgi:CelD/BcsL family acetyltransferase involved in cellulose biosynthesis